MSAHRCKMPCHLCTKPHNGVARRSPLAATPLTLRYTFARCGLTVARCHVTFAQSRTSLQDDGLWYRDSERVKEAMESMDNDLMMGQDVDTHRVNSLLRDLLSTENHSCVKRIHYYLDTKKIEPDEETLGLMMNIYDERKEFVEANSIPKKAKEYHLLPSADMYNFSIGGFFQMVLLTTKLQESCYNEAKGTLVSSLAKFGYVDDALESWRYSRRLKVESTIPYQHLHFLKWKSRT